MTLEIWSQESPRVFMQSHQVAPGEAKSWVSCWTGLISGAPETTNEGQSICSRYYFWVTNYPQTWLIKRIFLLGLRVLWIRNQGKAQWKQIVSAWCRLGPSVRRYNIWGWRMAGWFSDRVLETSWGATCLMANASCQLGPQLWLSTEAPTWDLSRWLPHSMVASG